MCGIAGAFLKQGEVAESALQQAADAIAHRGPDGHGLFAEKGVGLVHTRLSIIDLEHGGQPLYGEDDQLCLVANGEVYNYLELRQQLHQQGHRFSTHSDCEPLMAAYREYGEAFLEQLQGMYAFALYDRANERLIIARDRLGIKPLFLKQDQGGVYFASELKALTKLSGARPEIDRRGLVQYLQNNFSATHTTLLQGVTRVQPGEAVVIEKGCIVKRWRYWTPNHIQPYQGDEAQARQDFDVLMDEVMQIHLRSDVPFGLFLSGGVDSAVLLAMLDKHVAEPISTYSVGFPGSSVVNELNTAGEMAKQFKTRHTVLELGEQDLLNALPHSIWAADELMGDYANLPVALLAQRAAQDLKVVFSGEGGDEVFGGYARYRMPVVKRFLKQLRYPGSGGFRMSKSFKSPWEKAIYSPELMAVADAWSEPFISSWQALPGDMDSMARMQAVDMQTWLADDLLVKADRMLMAWGVEGRVPFLDHRIVEFGLSLPVEMKVQGKTGKQFLRRWAEAYLPHGHLWSRKRGFTVPVRDWLSGARLDQLAQLLPVHPGVRQWFKAEGVKQLIARQRSKGDMVQPLWRLWQFAIWHSIFIDGEGAMPAAQSDPIAIIG